jgi:hypothetical protein
MTCITIALRKFKPIILMHVKEMTINGPISASIRGYYTCAIPKNEKLINNPKNFLSNVHDSVLNNCSS